MSHTKAKMNLAIKTCDQLEGQVKYAPAQELRRSGPGRPGQLSVLSIADELDPSVAYSFVSKGNKLRNVSLPFACHLPPCMLLTSRGVGSIAALCGTRDCGTRQAHARGGRRYRDAD